MKKLQKRYLKVLFVVNCSKNKNYLIRFVIFTMLQVMNLSLKISSQRVISQHKPRINSKNKEKDYALAPFSTAYFSPRSYALRFMS